MLLEVCGGKIPHRSKTTVFWPKCSSKQLCIQLSLRKRTLQCALERKLAAMTQYQFLDYFLNRRPRRQSNWRTTMKKFWMAAFAALTLTAVVSIGASDSAYACKWKATQPCGVYNQDPGKTFSGNQLPTDMIAVTVCHPYWSKLLAPKWWGPTVRYASWHADLPAVHSQCSTRTVKRGSVIDSYASCVHRVIRTARLTRPGTYWMN